MGHSVGEAILTGLKKISFLSANMKVVHTLAIKSISKALVVTSKHTAAM